MAANDPIDVELHCSRSFGTEIQLREIESPVLITLLAEEGEQLAAFAQMRTQSPIACVCAERPSELYRLYVMTRWHGLGVAHDMMKEILSTAQRIASDCIWLGVWERNERALAFYRKFGFEVVGDHAFLFGREPQTDLVMALAIDAPSAA